MKKYILFFVITVLTGAFLFAADDIPAPPNPPRLVVDFADIFTPDQEAALEAKVLGYEDSTTTQFAVVTVPSLKDYEVSDFANRLFTKWGIGQKGKDNGLLILISPEHHDVWIEVGYGLEPKIPDLFAKQVVEEVLIPNFKEGRFYDGTSEGIDVLIKRAAGEFKGKPKKKGKGTSLWTIFIIMLIVFFIINRMGGGGGNSYSRRGRRGGFLGPGMGGFGGGGFGGGFGGGGGGGFGGFGGGGSGGGGAGGKW